MHFDGSEWRHQTETVPQVGALGGVWGAGPTDVWAVGGVTNPVSGSFPTVLHYDGSTWTDASPGLPGGRLLDAWGSGPADVWAVGELGTVLHWDGAWSAVEVPTSTRLRSVWGTAPDDVWVVGGGSCPSNWPFEEALCDRGIAGRGVVLHFDGAEWTEFPAPASRELLDVWGTAPDDVWAVGFPGIVLHFDGVVWTRLGWEP